MVQDFEKIRVLISHVGKLHWEPGGIFSTTCDIDISFFPFDTQRCPIKIGAWAYYSQRMNLTNSSSIVPMHDFRMNGEWQVVSTGVAWGETVLPCCKTIGYSYVEFALELRRRTIFYIVNIILPCLMLSILVLVMSERLRTIKQYYLGCLNTRINENLLNYFISYRIFNM